MLHRTTQSQVLVRRDIPTLVSGTLLALSAALLINGCAERSTVHAESREIPLTSGDGNHSYPCFSPDGHQIVYTSKEGLMANVIHLVDSQGGEATRVNPDPIPSMVVGWVDEGKSLLVYNYGEQIIQRLSLTGEIEPGHKISELSWLARVGKDGQSALWCRLNGDNLDLVVQDLTDGSVEMITTTPEWEMDSCFGPGEGEITFVRSASYKAPTNKIFVLSQDAESEELLPLPESKIIDPIWSMDRRYLAYISDAGGNNDLWIYEAETKRSVQMTDTPEKERHPDWSPDGEWITFSRAVETSKLFLGDPETYERRPLTSGKGTDFAPRPSPDGKWTAFFREYPASESGAQRTLICVVSNETAEVKELDLGGLNPMAQERVFEWSPDATEIAFPADDGSGNVDIYRVPRDGGVPERVTLEPGLDIGPSWSPDGKTIAYTRLAGGESQVWTIPASGGLPRRISDGEGMNHNPVWAPDSERIAYSRNMEAATEVELWIASTRDPSQTYRAIEAQHGNYAENWTKDGRQILVWRMKEETGVLYLFDLETSSAKEIGRSGKDKKEHFVDLKKKGRQYADLIYPGGVHVFSDGERISNIYTMQVPEIIEERLSASGEEF